MGISSELSVDNVIGDLPEEVELPVMLQGAWVTSYFPIFPASAQSEETQVGTVLACFAFRADGTFSAKSLPNFSGTPRPEQQFSGIYSLGRNQDLGIVEGEIIRLDPSDPPGGPAVKAVTLACILKSRRELAWVLRQSHAGGVIMQGTMEKVAY